MKDLCFCVLPVFFCLVLSDGKKSDAAFSIYQFREEQYKNPQHFERFAYILRVSESDLIKTHPHGSDEPEQDTF